MIGSQHYILAEGKVQIVDESTGRVMAHRTWAWRCRARAATWLACAAS
jgi:preprotein translocase subunit SecA